MPHHTTPHHRFVSSVLEWITHESAFIFLITFLNITVAGVTYKSFLFGSHQFIIESMILTRDLSLSFLMITAADILLYLVFSRNKAILKSAKFIFLAVNIFTFLADLFTMYYFKYPLNYMMLEIIRATNFREAGEFMQAYVFDARLILLEIGAIVLLLTVWSFLLLIRKKKIMLAFVFTAGIFAGIYSLWHEVIYLKNAHNRPVKSVGLFRLAFMAHKLHSDTQDFIKTLDEQKDILITNRGRNIPYVVFILGESTTRNHMSLYGYELPTTPNLESRLKEGGLYVFSDIISPHANTSAVMRKLFSFYRYGDKGQWFSYTNIFMILKAAGWRTVWLSNQEKHIGGNEVHLYSYYCDVKSFVEEFKEDFSQGNTYDEELMPLLDEAMKTEADKNFYMIQLMGCHVHYHKRYPHEKFSKFTYRDEGGFDGISDHMKTIRANYDNAVLYNDFVVDGIIRRFENENAIVIYVSDHGEEVYDSMNFYGHGGEVPSKFSIEIPFIIWTSPKFRKAYPGLESQIASSINRPYMTDDMIHTVLDIAGIETPGYDPAQSIINPKFDSSRKRIYAGMQYDKDTGLHEIQ